MLNQMKWRYRLTDARAMLESEYRLIKAGAVRELAALDQRRLALIAQITDIPAAIAAAHEPRIQEIRRLAARNQRLLRAYLDGAADAAARLQGLEREKNQIGAYGPDGARMSSGGSAPTRESRA